MFIVVLYINYLVLYRITCVHNYCYDVQQFVQSIQMQIKLQTKLHTYDCTTDIKK